MARPPDTPEQRALKTARRQRAALVAKYGPTDNRWVVAQLRGYDERIAKLESTVRAQGRKV